MVSARRACTYQLRVLAQHRAKGYSIAGNDCINCGFESGDFPVSPDSLSELLEMRPILESMHVGDHQPRVVKIQGGGSYVVHRLAAEAWMLPLETPLGCLLARLQSLEERGRLPLVLLESGAERKETRVRHTLNVG